MGRATLIGFCAVAMWAFLALLIDASGTMPPFQLSAITFAIGTCVGLVARLFMPAAAKQEPVPAIVWVIGIAGLFGYHFSTSPRCATRLRWRPASSPICGRC